MTLTATNFGNVNVWIPLDYRNLRIYNYDNTNNVRILQVKKLVFLALILTVLAQARAQTFSVIHNFTNAPDGNSPRGGVVSYNGTLYGTTYGGGTNGTGAIFKMNLDGSGCRILKSFSSLADVFNQYTNADGANPSTGLTVSGDMIYGVAAYGGPFGNGTIFSLTTNGANFRVLQVFNNNLMGIPVQGASPVSRLILVGSLLYGTVGGVNGGLFSISTNGMNFTIITNTIASPQGDLILDGNTFYGIDSQTVFSMNTNGMNYFPIMNFADGSTNGSLPIGLALSGSTLYGLTYEGGTADNGTVFRVNTDGSGFEVLRSLGSEDGIWPTSNLILVGNTLYGATYMGGPQAFGSLFQINTDGSGFNVIKAFSGNSGTFLMGDLMLSGNTLYGTADSGGMYNSGVVYTVDLTPIVTSISNSMPMLNLSWNTISNHVYQLQCTTNLTSAGWQNVGNSITATNNSISKAIAPGGGTQQFYRINLVQ